MKIIVYTTRGNFSEDRIKSPSFLGHLQYKFLFIGKYV